MRRLHTEVPPLVDRNSGSRVRLPVITTRLMLVAAISGAPSLRRRRFGDSSGEGTWAVRRNAAQIAGRHQKFAQFWRTRYVRRFADAAWARGQPAEPCSAC